MNCLRLQLIFCKTNFNVFRLYFCNLYFMLLIYSKMLLSFTQQQLELLSSGQSASECFLKCFKLLELATCQNRNLCVCIRIECSIVECANKKPYFLNLKYGKYSLVQFTSSILLTKALI